MVYVYTYKCIQKYLFFRECSLFSFQFRSFHYNKCSSGQPEAASSDGKCTDCIFFSLNFLFHIRL